MNVNVPLIALALPIFAIIIGGLCYYLGKRKTKTPVIAGVMGFVFSFVPIVALIFLIVLLNKDDLDQSITPSS